MFLIQFFFLQTLKDKRTVVVEQLKKMQAETEPILAMFMNPEVTRQIQSSRDSRQLLDYLTKNHGLKPEMLDKLYLFAKFQYECGNYSGAAEYLHFHRFLVTPNDKVSWLVNILYVSKYLIIAIYCFVRTI
jgi:translation initiation factor 3 subunit E